MCSLRFVICELTFANGTCNEEIHNCCFFLDINGFLWREDQVQETIKWFSECTLMMGQNIHFLSVPFHHKVVKTKQINSSRIKWSASVPCRWIVFGLWGLSFFNTSNSKYLRQRFSKFCPPTISTYIIWKLIRNVHSQASSLAAESVTCALTSSPGDWLLQKFENHCSDTALQSVVHGAAATPGPLIATWDLRVLESRPTL